MSKDKTPPSLEDSFNDDGIDATESVNLVKRYQAGDREALNELLVRYQDRLRRIVRIQLGAGMRRNLESMDIVQEANIVAAGKLDEFELRGASSILHWLSQISLNQIRSRHDYFSAKKRDRDREVPLDAQDGSVPRPPGGHDVDQAPQPMELAWRKELREILDEGMLELDPKYREIILMRDYCEMSWSEVASGMNYDDTHAPQQLHRRAWIKLRRIVRPRLGTLRRSDEPDGPSR
ncbi:MAG: sigma-70 family RNA polymerase sigma factor [bacterium]|nr:sigma-70 family RNA polymerase sigma factor [bacterium]